jgi:hypothetical protein
MTLAGNPRRREPQQLTKLLTTRRMDAPLMAMTYLIAALGVQSKAVEDHAATKAFVRQMADLIEGNVKTLRGSGVPFFGEQIGMYRADQMH